MGGDMDQGEDSDEGEEGNWEIVASPQKTYNLLELVNGMLAHLGASDLEPGIYKQMRLMIGETSDEEKNLFDEDHPYANYVVEGDGQYYELKVPSGVQSGVKLVRSFEIIEDETTELILDFNASESVIKAGRSGQYKMKPTIKVLNRFGTAVVNGTVTDDVEPVTEIERALVTAQSYDTDAIDEKDQVTVASTTISDEDGAFKMFLEPGAYFMVAWKEDYYPACAETLTQANMSYSQDFLLTPAASGTVTVTFDGIEDNEDVVVSFRKQGVCGGDERVEVIALNLEVEDGEAHVVSLPGGLSDAAPETYRAVAATDDSTLGQAVSVVADEDTPLAFDFTPQP
jgi:hypothetical protein